MIDCGIYHVDEENRTQVGCTSSSRFGVMMDTFTSSSGSDPRTRSYLAAKRPASTDKSAADVKRLLHKAISATKYYIDKHQMNSTTTAESRDQKTPNTRFSRWNKNKRKNSRKTRRGRNDKKKPCSARVRSEFQYACLISET